MIEPDYSKRPPTDLAGWQMICRGEVREGDIVTPPGLNFQNGGEWAQAMIGWPIDPATQRTVDTHQKPGGWRVYRWMPTPLQGGQIGHDEP